MSSPGDHDHDDYSYYGVYKYTRTEFGYIDSNDLYLVTGMDLDTCIAICDLDTYCMAFVFYENHKESYTNPLLDGECQLKTASTPVLTYGYNTDLYVKGSLSYSNGNVAYGGAHAHTFTESHYAEDEGGYYEGDHATPAGNNYGSIES